MKTRFLDMTRNATKLANIINDALLAEDADLPDIGLALIDVSAQIYAKIHTDCTLGEDQRLMSVYASAVYALAKEYREQNSKNS